MLSLMEFKVNTKYHRIFVIFFFVLFVALFVGCTTSTNNGSADLIGTWSMSEEFGNYTYRVFYEFHSNSSFFTGVQNMSSQQYDFSLWGTYSVTDSRINLTVQEPHSTSDLKYSVSEDGNTLLLYYEDETNFDKLTRE